MSEQSMASIASGGSKAVSSFSSAYSESRAIKSQSAYEAQQLEFNSKIAKLQAKDAILRGKEASNAEKLKTKQLVGKQRAALAAQGIEVNADSALALQEDTAQLGALDALTIRNNAFREATGYRIQAIDYSGQAGFERIAGKQKAKNTLITGGLTALNHLYGG